MKRIGELKAILADEKLLLGVIREEIKLIRDKYGDDRKTSLGVDDDEITVEDLIKRENTVIAMTQLGYIKRMTMDNFRSQNRGGRGINCLLYTSIGAALGNKDHTTVLHGIKKIKTDLEKDDQLRSTIDIITKKLNPPK